MKNIILCADDYGQNAAISQAIIDLVKEKKLSAVSCLMNFPDSEKMANWLYPFKKDIAIGLHFNLTQGKPLSSGLSNMYSLKELLVKSQLHRLDKKIIAAELRAQFEKFVGVFGKAPDFIDGHQHIHQFPQIRDVVFELYDKELRHHHAYLRCTYNRKTLFNIFSPSYLKQLILLFAGGLRFKKELLKRRIPHNSSFSGIYNFSGKADYAKLFEKFLNYVEEGGMIMCHPGLKSESEQDELYVTRPKEYDFFMSEKFTNMLNKSGTTLFNDGKPI